MEIKNEITQMPEVKSVEYISDQEAKKTLLERHPELKDSLTETQGMLNLASLNIRAAEASQYQAIVSYLETASFKDSIKQIDYIERKPVIDKIFSITSAINRTGFILSLILACVAFLVAYNQVKLAICNTREEIFIQRLVGASNWFIRGPFLIQGVIAGFFATFISLIIFIPAVWFLGPRMENFFAGLNLSQYFFSNFILILSLQTLTGVSLGVVSSIIAMRNYLKV
jgi:cell division transport system permease protein